MTCIKSILTIDLSGQACAHCIGGQTYSGLGGAFEFVVGSQLSPGGKSVSCLPSTAVLKDGTEVSNIVARHPTGTRITIPEQCTDWVATEYGAVRLKLLPLEQRAAALIEIAHPRFREQLEREAREIGLRMDHVSRLPKMPAGSFHKVQEDAVV
jgi:acyl-CoA hydrolase